MAMAAAEMLYSKKGMEDGKGGGSRGWEEAPDDQKLSQRVGPRHRLRAHHLSSALGRVT